MNKKYQVLVHNPGSVNEKHTEPRNTIPAIRSRVCVSGNTDTRLLLPIHAVVVLFAIVAAELSGAGVLWETSQQQQTATPQHS